MNRVSPLKMGIMGGGGVCRRVQTGRIADRLDRVVPDTAKVIAEIEEQIQTHSRGRLCHTIVAAQFFASLGRVS
jgi:hypothetical protein